ncbi:type II toxin-antitoxin system Phd/YefM family antitoxin [Psychrobacter arenosus]|uniref:type II toxin-antitoxin system Phd/YefM family antitoxin n=1 Tax=Psychrobacter arenosus TaxID=256326 RepID=UPI001918A913|nr:type II toxin-antitoxin system Phd/YefM family antitoxin [Psychrobacter arenosus]
MQQVTSQEFRQSPDKILQQADNEPVLITQHGIPERVIMSFEQYQAINAVKKDTKPFVSAADALSGSPEVADIDFDPPRVEIGFRSVEF